MKSETYLDDCMNLLASYSDQQFTLGHVDPPYFSGPEKREFYGKSISNTNIKRRNYLITENWEVPNIQYYNQLKRVTKNQIIWGANYFDFIENPFKTPRRNEIDSFIESHPTNWIIWDKCNGNTSFNDYELAYTSFNEPTYIFKFMWNGMCQGKSIAQGYLQRGNKKLNQKRIHPTEKPIELYKYINNRYCINGDSILDTHLGSGSHRIACYDLGIDFTGIEKNHLYFYNQEHRFNQYKNKSENQFKINFT